MTRAPSATRTRDLPLRRSFHAAKRTAVMLLSVGFLVVLVPLDAGGFRSVLARGWHGYACSSYWSFQLWSR